MGIAEAPGGQFRRAPVIVGTRLRGRSGAKVVQVLAGVPDVGGVRGVRA